MADLTPEALAAAWAQEAARVEEADPLRAAWLREHATLLGRAHAALAAELASLREQLALTRDVADADKRHADLMSDENAGMEAELGAALKTVARWQGENQRLIAERDMAHAELRGVAAAINATGITGEGSAESHWAPLLIQALAKERDEARAQLASVEAVIARYRADDVNALTAFADIMGAVGDGGREAPGDGQS